VEELVPSTIALSLEEWKLDHEGKYSSKAQAAHFMQVFAKNNLRPWSILSYNLDATALNPATIAEPALAAGGVARLPEDCENVSGPAMVPCAQHEHSSSTKVLLERPETGNPITDPFTIAVDGVAAFGKWMRASPKRHGPLFKKQVDMGVTRPLLPLPAAATRFLISIIACGRALKLMPAVKAILADIAAGTKPFDVITAKEFKAVAEPLVQSEGMLVGIAKLFAPVLQLSPLLGSQDKYTLPLRRPMLQMILDVCAEVNAEDTDAEGVHGDLANLAVRYRADVWTRIVPAGWFAVVDEHGKSIAPAGAGKPRGVAERDRVRLDDVDNLALYLSPEHLAQFEGLGGNPTDALAFSVRLLVNSVSPPKDVGAVATTAGEGEGAGGAGAASTRPSKRLRAKRATSTSTLSRLCWPPLSRLTTTSGTRWSTSMHASLSAIGNH
jgi:hypothetical protein